MTFDWTINVGHVASLVVLLVTFVRAHITNRERLVRIETRLEGFERELGRMRR